MSDDAWTIFDLGEMLDKHRHDTVPYHEFLRVPSLSAGIYRVRAGAPDMQSEHLEDEVYFVLAGRARVRIGNDLREVGPGSLLYVRATEDHSFFEVEEDLSLLVFFASGGVGESPFPLDDEDD